MKKLVSAKNLFLFMTLVFNLVLTASVIFLMTYVQQLLKSDARIDLMEVVTQNKDVITSKLMMEVNDLSGISRQIGDYLADQEEVNDDVLRDAFDRYSGYPEESSLFVADKDGMALLSDGSKLDISGRYYYRTAMDGMLAISDKTISRIDGNEVFIISVPLTVNDQVAGTLQRSYTEQEMYNLCEVSLFSDQGFMHIINSEGYILLSTGKESVSVKSDNYFRDLYESGNKTASMQIENDLKNGKSGFLETKSDGISIFSAYTSLESIHDWNLITSVPTTTVSPNSATVVKLFYVILFSVLLIFTSCLLYFSWYKNRQKRRVEKIAFVDPVTEGNTFGKFITDVPGLLKDHPGIQFYILRFDIDNFKYVNNYYGFDYGDQILKQIYKDVAEKLEEGECLARISGDNFVVLLKHAEDERVQALLHYNDSGEGLSIYFSAGLYPVCDAEEDINLMVDKAGIAAHTVKGTMNRNIGIYSEEYDLMAQKNEELKQAVKLALKNSEFEPFYQSKVNVDTGEVVGAEALVRWRTPDNRLVPPGHFIPMCEQTGLVVELDLLVMEKVLQFIRKQRDQGIEGVPISVNYSRMHLLDEVFFTEILDMVKRYDVPPRLVEVELTESAIFDNLDTINVFTENLHKHGFTVVMDDFGSGYSSLNMLKDISIDVLKIDKGFLTDTLHNDKRQIIFSAIIRMARELGIEVVVEGVENLEHVELMRQCGCNIAQGFYFSRPVEEAVFEKIFKDRTM